MSHMCKVRSRALLISPLSDGLKLASCPIKLPAWHCRQTNKHASKNVTR